MRREYSGMEGEANKIERRPNNASSGVGGVDLKRFSPNILYS